MNYSGWGIAAVVLVAHLGIYSVAEAITWSVKTNGGVVVCQGNGTPTANLPANCGSDLQFVASGAAAKIEAIDGGNNDILHLINTKIVALKNLTDYVLAFDHTFAPPPTINEMNPMYYRTRMFGTYISGSAPANKITVTSTVEHPVGTPLLSVALQSAPPPQLNFDYYASPFTTTNMNQNRKIIVNVKFSLQNTKYINFGTGRFIKVSAQDFPDPRDTEGESAISLSEIQKILEESDGIGCIGLSLPGGNCAGGLEVKK